MIELTDQDKEVLRQLRKNGCAVCVFLPHEIKAAEPDDVEEAMCVGGWNAINNANPDDIVV